RDPMRNTPYISEAANRQWIVYNEQANAALLSGDLVSASELATKMVELDGGVSVAGYYLLAECSRRQGDMDSARHYLESARDAVIWDTSIVSLSPRPYSIAQKILREEPLK